MAQLAAWMGAGMVAAGVSAAMIAGADTASAETGSDTAGASASASADRGPAGGDATPGGTDTTDSSSQADPSDGDETDDDDEAGKAADPADEVEIDDTENPSEDEVDPDAALPDTDADADADADADRDVSENSGADDSEPGNGGVAGVTEQRATADDLTSVVPDSEPVDGPIGAVGPDPAVATGGPKPAPESQTQARKAVSTAAGQQVSTTLSTPAEHVAPPARTLEDVFQSLMMEIIGAAVRFVSGPPVVPWGSKVTVRTSRLEIEDGRYVRADWYYPNQAEPPQGIIYLQHGYLGIGPMYSYTASWLAESTNSIVVAPTLSSNRYVHDKFWLGDDQVYRATAELLLGDRDALTASAVAAGFAKKYGADATLPDRFTMVGHSLGAGVAAGAAGYYADAVIASGVPNQLAGIILLDGAPPGEVLRTALEKFDGLGTYIPVIELGAPRDGETRRVDAALNGHRPGRFNGVVLDRGQHLDAMQGGSWLITFVSYLYQGFPTAQNKSAAQTLIAGWAGDIFAGRIDPSTGACGGVDCDGIYGEPGQALTLETPKGPATGVVIGTPAAPTRTEFRPLSVSSLVSPRSTAVRLSIAG